MRTKKRKQVGGGCTTASGACPDEQHIICDGHRRWLEGCTELARAALRGIAALNEE